MGAVAPPRCQEDTADLSELARGPRFVEPRRADRLLLAVVVGFLISYALDSRMRVSPSFQQALENPLAVAATALLAAASIVAWALWARRLGHPDRGLSSWPCSSPGLWPRPSKGTPFAHPLARNNPNVAAAKTAHAGRLQSQTRRPLNETKIDKGSSTSKKASICPATWPK